MNIIEMIPEQIRVRCCEIEGIEPYRFEEDFTQPPDYIKSIDVINAAVLRLPLPLQKKWAFSLIDILEPVTPEPELGKAGAILLMITASALDRARAFVAIYS